MSAQDRGWGPPCPAGEIVRIDAGGRSFNVHRRVAPIFRAFITELVTRGYPIDKGTLDDWSYVCRKIAGSTEWSNHAWGLAVDINSLTNPMKAPPMVTDMPAWVRNATDLLTRYGLRWGGTYSGRPDPMHFEFMLTPADADRIAAGLGTVEREWWQMPDIPKANLDQIGAEVYQQVMAAFKYRPPYIGSDPDGKTNSINDLLGQYGAGVQGVKRDTATVLANQAVFKVETQTAKVERAAMLAAINNIDVAGMTDAQAAVVAGQIADQMKTSDLPAAFIAALARELQD